MHPFDLIVVIIMLWAAIAGYRDGLLKQVVSLIGFAAGLYIAYRFGTAFSEQTGLSGTIAFIVLCIGVPLLGSLLASLLTKLFDATAALGLANRLGGLALSMLKYVVLLSFAVYVGAKFFTVPETLETESKFFAPFLSFATWLWTLV